MSSKQTISLPDIGNPEPAEVIEVICQPGDSIQIEDSLISLESNKATMDIPSPLAGTITEVLVSVGDKIKTGDQIAIIEGTVTEAHTRETASPSPEQIDPSPAEAIVQDSADAETDNADTETGEISHPDKVTTTDEPITPHASPLVRRFARELGAPLARLSGSGPKNRILKEDIKQFTRRVLSGSEEANPNREGLPIQRDPIDFSKFGEVETHPLTHIKQISGAHLHQSWVSIPHVSQFDEADITELEGFRQSLQEDAQKRQLKLTLMAFLVKAVVKVLQQYPTFNASLSAEGNAIVIKKYFHIGIAVNTDHGLLVPVIRNADQKGILDIATEINVLSEKARSKKIRATDMQGGCFTLSSLGGIGGKQFTPIINPPELAILGISRATLQPSYQDGQWIPRLILPYALSYDHRVIDGVAGARFTRAFAKTLEGIYRLLL